MATQVSSRKFNQGTGGAKKAAERGPVFITDRGRPSYGLLTFDTYEKQLGAHVVDRLGEPAGVEDVDLVVPVPNESTALVHRVAVVTRNIKDFGRFEGLAVVNPWT